MNKKKNPNPLLGKLSPATNKILRSDAESLQQDFVNHLEFSQAKDKYSATTHDFLNSLAFTVRDRLFERWIETQQTYYKKDAKRVYYISMEYMIGRLLCNALINLGIKGETEKAMWELGLDLEELKEAEFDAGLGNGGLGRLAACFLDSMATLELPAYGYGIRYEYGIFSQKIKDGWQVEAPDSWLRYGNPWEIERPEYLYVVKFYGRVHQHIDKDGRVFKDWTDTEDIVAVAYDTPIPGYGNNTVNNLRLWSAKASRDFNLEYFNDGDYDEAVQDKIASEVISKVLYPRDDFIKGRELRLKQEYFLVSATLQDIMRRFKKIYKTQFELFPDKAAIQLNDTHPSLAIPELMRLLIDEEQLPWEKAWEITKNTFGYTNHTVMPEALETWRVGLMENLLPRHVQIIYEINHLFLRKAAEKFKGDIARMRRLSIIEEGHEKRIRMANLAIIGSHSVNGVAALHTEIIKHDIFQDFFEIWSEKFNNKTNGITQRRWLLQSNPELAELISEKIGSEWITDLYKIKEIEKSAKDEKFQTDWQQVKQNNKNILADCIQEKLGIDINLNSIFDCQIKRIHEYKRQLLNVLHVIYLYNQIKTGLGKDIVPRTVIFSGKAAPAYHMAKLIIKLINNTAQVINNDPDIGGKLKIVFLPNYSVSLAEIIIPAADLSEQISTAGMEASGTGNMKFALNGALTIGTLDGANVEMKEEVGDDNIFIFGLTADEVLAHRSSGYHPKEIYNSSKNVKNVLDRINSGFFSPQQAELFRPIADTLLNSDYYLLLADFEAYITAQRLVENTYLDKQKWTEMSIINAANMGKFSSDRTIKEYADEIWRIKPVPIKMEREK